MAWSLSKAFKNLFEGARQVESQDWESLEDTLLQADFGPRVTDEVIEAVHAIADASANLDTDDLRRILGEVLEERLDAFDPTLSLASEPGKPAVVLVVGVNGGSLVNTGTVAMRIVDFVEDSQLDSFPDIIVKFNFGVHSYYLASGNTGT